MHLQIAYSSDQNYVKYLKASLLSLLVHNHIFKNITVHVLSSEITLDAKNEIASICEGFSHKAIFYEFSDIRRKLGNLKVETIALAAYSRLFLTEVISSDVDKILYLDCDSIIKGSFEKLWTEDNEKFSICGVEDIVPTSFKTAIGLKYDHRYINSGMILINLKKLRYDGSFDKILNFINEADSEIPHHDQGIINKVFSDSIKILPPNYNVMTPFYLMNSQQLRELYTLDNYYSDNELNNATKNPIFVHFTQSYITRPWVKKSEHPLKDEFLRYFFSANSKDAPLDNDLRIFKVKLISILFKLLPFRLFLIIINRVR